MGLLDRFRKRGAGEQTPADVLVDELMAKHRYYWDIDLKTCESGKALMEDSREAQKEMVLGLVEKAKKLNFRNDYNSRDYKVFSTTMSCLLALMRRRLPFTDADLTGLFKWLRVESSDGMLVPVGGVARALENYAKENEISAELKEAARFVAKQLHVSSGNADSRKFGNKIAEVLGAEDAFSFASGDVWADAATGDLAGLDAGAKRAWSALLSVCQGANGGKPTKLWIKEATLTLERVGTDRFREFVPRWFDLAGKPAEEERREGNSFHTWALHPLQMCEANQDVLKGLAWSCSLQPDPEITRAVATLCVSAFKKIPGKGPRAARLGNACIYTLGAIEGIDALGQLALIKVKIRNRSVQKLIAKALESAAEREGVTTEDLEEMSVPEYGLTGVGLLEEEMGDFRARLRIEGTNSTSLVWIKPDGKPQKSVPASVKTDFADDLKDLRATAKDIQKMLPAVRERIDGLYLAQKSWPYSVWKARYHDHPLVGSIARRLIWTFGEGESAATAIFYEGKFVDSHGNEVPDPVDPETQVKLWHPLDGEPTAALSWRNWLEEYLVQQPFKQAHREIYLLTEAEENTGTYSNRFAAHIIRQHQFNALCLARGWRNSLRLMVDDEYPPASKDLPKWGIRAEYWIEGIGDNYGVDTNDAGTYLYLATDQVRFYQIDAAQMTAHAGGGGYGRGWGNTVDAEPLPLTDVPPLVFSEIMRDVDLFVGVASVGNDPAWSDGGPAGTHRDYWHSYSFGDLSATAKTRKEILERLLPRLKIAKKSRIEGKFLVVEGEIRTYKIHLGSGNILMEPNDQYLCIVPNASIRKSADNLFLPFEGDAVMAIVLSKAFLLADDKKIKDPTIVSQITRK